MENSTQADVQAQLLRGLAERSSTILADAAGILPLVEAERLDPDSTSRIGRLLLELLGRALRDGRVDSRSDLIIELHRVASARSIPIERLFAFAYLLERSALDELAADAAAGSSTESWPLAVQLIRRASFDLLAAITGRALLEPTDASLVDPVTTLFSRPVFDTALRKELDRAARFDHPISLILFDVDRLADLNATLGPGVGDKLLERIGILISGFFRQHDWVARYADDTFAVLLPETVEKDAGDLADRVRRAVASRLEFTDHRTGKPVRVTVSTAVVSRKGEECALTEPERLIAEAQALL